MTGSQSRAMPNWPGSVRRRQRTAALSDSWCRVGSSPASRSLELERGALTPFVMLLCVAMLAVLALVVDGGRGSSARQTALGEAAAGGSGGCRTTLGCLDSRRLDDLRGCECDRSRGAVHGRLGTSRLCDGQRHIGCRDGAYLWTHHSSARARRDRRHSGVRIGRRLSRRRIARRALATSGPKGRTCDTRVCLTDGPLT